MPPPGQLSTCPEWRLALLLCRWPISDSEKPILEDEARALCSRITDWEIFLRFVSRHRVHPLVAKNAQWLALPLPGNVYEQLQTWSASNAMDAFRYLAELQRLRTILDKAGVRSSVIKGVALSIQAYGDVSTRDIGDIDLLIADRDAETADRVLLQERDNCGGFHRSDPAGALTPKRLSAYLHSFKDFTYQPALDGSRGQQSGFEVDLHWRLFRNPYMPGNGLSEASQVDISAGSITLPTFSKQVNLLYLSAHGAVDGWTRLKAVADIAALWKGMSPVEQKAAVELAKPNGMIPYLHSALLLAAEWIGGLDLPELAMTPEQRRRSAATVATARKLMEENSFMPPLRETSSWKLKLHEASLDTSRRYRWAIVRRVLYRPRVWSRFDLPDKWFVLYPLLSPIEWLLFRIDGQLRRARLP